jgi:hypothetical protein
MTKGRTGAAAHLEGYLCGAMTASTRGAQYRVLQRGDERQPTVLEDVHTKQRFWLHVEQVDEGK